MAKDLSKTLADLKEDEVLAIVQERLNAGGDAMAILEEARQAMETVGKRFANNEYFIPDLVYSGEILRKINELVKPKLATRGAPRATTQASRRGRGGRVPGHARAPTPATKATARAAPPQVFTKGAPTARPARPRASRDRGALAAIMGGIQP